MAVAVFKKPGGDMMSVDGREHLEKHSPVILMRYACAHFPEVKQVRPNDEQREGREKNLDFATRHKLRHLEMSSPLERESSSHVQNLFRGLDVHRGNGGRPASNERYVSSS